VSRSGYLFLLYHLLLHDHHLGLALEGGSGGGGAGGEGVATPRTRALRDGFLGGRLRDGFLSGRRWFLLKGVQSLGFGFRVQGLGLRVRIQGFEIQVPGLGFRFRVWDLGFRVRVLGV